MLPNRRVREDGSREIFFPPNKTECISRNSNEISPLDRARPFYRRSKLSPQGGKKKKRPQERPEIPENSLGKSEVHSTPRSYVTPPPPPPPILPSFHIRDDCPFIFNEGCLIQTVAWHARLNPFWRKKRVITIVHFHPPFHPSLPLPPSFYRSTDQAKRSRYSTSRARDRRASIKRKKDKPDEKSDFRENLTNARISSRNFCDRNIGSDSRRDKRSSCNQFNFNFTLLSRPRGQYYSRDPIPALFKNKISIPRRDLTYT